MGSSRPDEAPGGRSPARLCRHLERGVAWQASPGVAGPRKCGALHPTLAYVLANVRYKLRVRVFIHGHTLPGVVFEDGQSGHRYQDVHVAIQERDAAVQVVAADAEQVAFVADIEVVDVAGVADLRGPCVQGRRGDRFIYLTWGTLPEGGTFTMFRRAKLLLRDVDAVTLARAAQQGWCLVARLGLSDRCGSPRCASVRPPVVTWEAARTS